MIRRLLRRPKPTDHRFAPGEREATYPPPYPTGWYRVAASSDLGRGDRVALDVLGKHLVAYRGDTTGTVHVLDAHCPHQGASLAGGRVCGDGIECPFHRWRYGPDGDLQRVPGLPNVPRIGVRSWPVVERYGVIWLFHDASDEVVEPPYPAPRHPDIDDGTLRYLGERDAGIVRMHLVEFAENSVDFQHFAAIHDQLTVPWTTVPLPGLGIEHDPGWHLDPDERHIATFTDHACVTLLGRPMRWTGASAAITFYGPGGTVWFRFTVPDHGDLVLFQTHTPLEPLAQHVHFRWYADRRIGRVLAHWIVGNWVSQWYADIDVWQNKLYRRKPVLVMTDGPVHRMRRWLTQFYPDGESTPTRRPSPARSHP